MKNKSLLKRYAQGLLSSLGGDDEEYELIYQEIRDFAAILAEQKKLNNMLTRPFLPTSKKKKIVEEILSRALHEKTSRFILLLIENERLEILPDLIELLPELWYTEKGIVTYLVSSVIPLSDVQKRKLAAQLENVSGKPVMLKYHLEPTLIGGILVRKGNIIYDASIEGHLQKLQEQIIEEG